MANFIKLVISNYNEILDFKDPKVDTWPLMGSPGPLLCIMGTYLIFVLKAGPKMMEKRPAFQMNTILILYNGFQVLFSIWLTTLALEVDLEDALTFQGCYIQNKSYQRNKVLHEKLSLGAWWYFVAKIVELLDTVFFVLRKKQNQVTFLHVYHHTITAVFSWCYLKILPGQQGVVVGALNSIVHIFMYSYYLIAALGSKYRKYLWWKKYMTWIQLLQFGMMMTYLMLTLAMDCQMPKALTYFFITNIVIFIYLFSDFYRKTYKAKKIQ
ncbi:PREDICTED: elongation of very long chain fatty acids protein AAEL008004 [Dinoponera quadriceps]|uniref:Elongation of very long chain fatty acids protein n=1 Tax=Dinoponera quadriceps TaxID=609295 RepID=A0A6P3XJC2_DINQU|nr:PREDICTED: elongation of very long chain fatty acids protein AAEL008004 [Dinoponera quadriceps]